MSELVQIKATGISSGIEFVGDGDEDRPVLTVSGDLPDGAPVEVEVSYALLAALAIQAKRLDPAAWLEACITESERDRSE